MGTEFRLPPRRRRFGKSLMITNFGQCANATGYENFAKSLAAHIEAILAEVGCGFDPAKEVSGFSVPIGTIRH